MKHASPLSLYQWYRDAFAYANRTKGSMAHASGTAANLLSIASLRTWSYAPTPSMLSKVALSSSCVKRRTAWPTQSVPALVESANWKGEQAFSIGEAN
eukprot:6294749-Karenia_brevis.AAC.1